MEEDTTVTGTISTLIVALLGSSLAAAEAGHSAPHKVTAPYSDSAWG